MFFDDQWSTNVDLHLYTDSSGEAYGAILKKSWIMEKFTKEDQCQNITWKELFAIVVACATWGDRLCQKRILFHCDNLAVVHIIRQGVSKNIDIMSLVITLFYMRYT